MLLAGGGLLILGAPAEMLANIWRIVGNSATIRHRNRVVFCLNAVASEDSAFTNSYTGRCKAKRKYRKKY